MGPITPASTGRPGLRKAGDLSVTVAGHSEKQLYTMVSPARQGQRWFDNRSSQACLSIAVDATSVYWPTTDSVMRLYPK
jgi:hypothetical protein